MTLAAGARLGPYEILAPIGAGGMGEVYRARDSRLKREVAVKVLPATFSADADRLRRFEQEAQTAGGLNHPNITAVHELGTHDDAPYIVTELLEGETLRARLSGGAIPVRKATDYAIQIASGLAAAHEKGIVHRDLKPENLFLTNDGRVKILDFGLAKLTQTEGQAQQHSNLPTAATEPGVVLGTLGYMSPEQVKGRPADARSDIFAFGAILYEMLSGSRAFHRETAAETMSAILREEPPELSATNRNVPPGLDRVVRHCLEKNPEERFHSAHDLAFDLRALSDASTPVLSSASGRVAAVPASRRGVLITAALGAAAAAAAFLIGRGTVRETPPSFRQMTFRRGAILSARFAPDGQTVVYSAAWEGKPQEIFVGRPESPESRPFGLSGAEVLAVSRSGDMAVSNNRASVGGFRRSGTLAQLSVAGGAAPRDIAEEVEWADWAPDGKTLAVVRAARGQLQLEYPMGKVLYRTSGWVSHARVSPDGELVAFIDHPVGGDDGGSVAAVDRAGKLRKLSGAFATAQGLAWSPRGEVYFTAAEVGGNRALYSTTPSGGARLRVRIAGNLTLQDVSREGRLLVTRDTNRTEMLALAPGETKERELTWLDWSLPATGGISPDGRLVLFSESGEGGGPGYSVYVRKTDGSPAVRLGEGSAQALSPDGKWVLAIAHIASDPQLAAYPTGAGDPRFFSRDGVTVLSAVWLAEGRQILFNANEPGHGPRLYVRDFSGGKPRAISPEGYILSVASPDGRSAVATGPDRKYYLYPIAGGEPSAIPGLEPTDAVDQFTSDGRFVYVHRREAPLRVYRLELGTGRKELWRTLMPSDAAGVSSLSPIPTPSGDAYAYNYVRTLSDLYLVDGLK